MKCESCGRDVVPTCPECGQPVVVLHCRHCNEVIKPGWKACPSCGERLTETVLQAPTVSTKGPVEPRVAVVRQDHSQTVSDLKDYIAASMRESKTKTLVPDIATRRLQAWRSAADDGVPEGLTLVGMCHWWGCEVEKSHEKAFHLFETAASKGQAVAECFLGYCYKEGKGVTKNGGKAVEHFRKAADADLTQAQFEMARCFIEGTGGPKDESKATEWFGRAAELGDPSAQCMFGARLLAGNGCKQNNEEGAMWLRKAAAAGKQSAKDALEELEQIEAGHGEAKQEVEGASFGQCLMCHREVKGELFGGGSARMAVAFGFEVPKDGQAHFCPKCDGVVHKECARSGFFSGLKCPVCKTELKTIGKSGLPQLFG